MKDNLAISTKNLLKWRFFINEHNFIYLRIGSDLDIPRAQLDDSNEEIGEEDEENNYYCLSGDSHADLEESQE